MSSPAFAAPLVIESRPSRLLRALVIAGYAVAALGLIALGGPWAYAGPIAALAGAWRDWGRIAARPALTWHPDGHWLVTRRDGAEEMCRLDATTTVMPWVIVLVLRAGRSRRRFVVARDAVPRETWRRLRVRLQVQGAALAAGGRSAA